MNKPRRNNWLFALVLTTPMVVFFIGYLVNFGEGLVPTGFIQHDNVSYIAYAKQYLDGDDRSLFYSNPFNDHGGYQPIYVQPQTLFFALLLSIGVPPGAILIPFTLLCSLICFRLLIAVYDHLHPYPEFRTRNIWIGAWGGGLFVLAGCLIQVNMDLRHMQPLDRLFYLDPAAGWWGMNLGRSLFFSTEAYYHMLFLGSILCVLKRKWASSLLLTALLSLSHPFTGIEVICILGLWAVTEFIRNRTSLPWWFGAGILLIAVFHIYYYLIYLDSFPDHHSVSTQYTLAWNLRFYHMLPAWSLVGLLALYYFIKVRNGLLQTASNRLFICWFITAFLLANHEWFIEPMQPVHFTRGYIWTSLFLLGLPALQMLNKKIQGNRMAIVLILIVFLLDNALWIFNNVQSKANESSATYIAKEQKSVLEQLKKEVDNKTLLVSNGETISYLATVYTAAYPWTAHPFTTPFAGRKQKSLENFLKTGTPDPSWMGRKVFFVLKTNAAAKDAPAVTNRFEINKKISMPGYLIVRCDSLHFVP
jgi:hypothetical protein